MELTMLYPTYVCFCAVRYLMHKEDSLIRMAHQESFLNYAIVKDLVFEL
jgi:hypothetical protein